MADYPLMKYWEAPDGTVYEVCDAEARRMAENAGVDEDAVKAIIAENADPAGTATQKVSAHNVDIDSHQDIRLLIANINAKLNAFFDSDDATLDELSEIVAYIKSNKSLIDSITTSKVSVVDIINNLTTNVANKPLSAAQGVVLKGLIDDLTGSLSQYALKTELPSVPVQSVNNKTGAVQLTAADVGALSQDALTADSIKTALGFTPADTEDVNQLSAEKVSLPKDETGNPVYGATGAKAVSDGVGGIVWEEDAPTHKTVDVSGTVEITDCAAGDMAITDFSLPADAAELVVTARKNENVIDPALLFGGPNSAFGADWLTLKDEGRVTTKGVTITLENGLITCNGTATSQITIPVLIADAPIWLNPGTYQFCSCPEGGSATTYAAQWKRTDTDATVYLDRGPGYAGNPNITFNTNIPVRANYIIYSGCVCNNLQFNVQVLKGFGATTDNTQGWFRQYPFEGSSVTLTEESASPVDGLTAFEGYTAIDCRSDGSVSVKYPIADLGAPKYVSADPQELTEEQKSQARANIGARADIPMQHHDDAEFSVSVLNGSSQFSQNDITMVGDELWVSKENATYYDNGTMIFRYKMADGALTLVGTCDCDFSHLNTMDYCAANDCLIFGNGGNDTETTGNYFVVVKNPLSLGDTALIADVGIKYDVDIGYKVQALWGGSNLGANNIVYLLSNNAANITKVLLTKDASGEFDGSFVTLETHEVEAWGVQGADIFGDTLYIGGQLNNNEYAAVKEISLSDFSETRVVQRKFYADDGTSITGCVQGIYVDQDAVWICVDTGDSTKPVCLTKYRR